MVLFEGRPLDRNRLTAYIRAVGVVAATLVMAFMANQVVSHASLSLLFLSSVLIVSAWTGLGPSLLASLLSFLALNFFFTRPYYTLEVADEADVAMLVVFLLTAAVTGNLAARMRREVVERRGSLERTSNLYDFSRRMASAAGPEAVLEALADHLTRSIGRGVAIYVPCGAHALTLKAQAGPPVSIPGPAIEQLWSQSTPVGEQNDRWHAIKLVSEKNAMGMAVFESEGIGNEHLELTRSLCNQAAIALSRTQLVGDLEEARLTAETEQLRSALLSSVSHDLRTPLASIIGSTTSVLEYGESISEENRRELLSTAVDEAKRLDRHIQNLLDMTRLGQGRLKLRRDWVDMHDIISGAVDRVRERLKGLNLEIDIAEEIPLLWVHGALLAQAVVNVLDNAIRFSPDNGAVSLKAIGLNDGLQIEICDQGPGIADSIKGKVFDMFYTVEGPAGGGDRHGTGLGLAICQGIVAAHGGTVTALDGECGRGTCIRIFLPLGGAGGNAET